MKKINNSDPIARKLSYLVTIGVLVATLFFGAQTVQAAQWSFDPVIRVGYEFDDNAPLAVSPDSSDEIQGYIIEGRVTIGSATQRNTFDITPMIRSRNYDEERFDSDDGFLRLNYNHEGLKSNFRIRANYSQESVRTAERADADPEVNDPDEIVGDDSGRVFFIGDRKRFWILPQWSYDFSERSSVSAAVRYTEVDYQDTIPGTFVPFSDLRFDATLTRKFSTRTSGYIRASVGRIENEFELIGLTSETDGRGLTVGFQRDLTEATLFRAEVGVTETESNGNGSDTDPIYDVYLVRNLETVTLLAQFNRTVNSDGDGRVSLRDSINLRMTKQFSERFRGGLGVSAYSTDQLSSDNTIPGVFDERDYVQFRAQLSYALSRAFLVEADYRYAYIDGSTVVGSGKSNSIILWLTWQPNARARSR